MKKEVPQPRKATGTPEVVKPKAEEAAEKVKKEVPQPRKATGTPEVVKPKAEEAAISNEHYFFQEERQSVIVDQKYQHRRKQYDYSKQIPVQDKKLLGADYLQNNQSNDLFEAVSSKDIGVVKSLLAEGANINFHAKKNGYTPLMFSIQANNLDVAKYLIMKGANPSATTSNGMNALHLAAILGNTAAIEMMLDTNVDLNAKDINGKKFYDYLTKKEIPIVVNQIYSLQDDANKSLLLFSNIGMKEGIIFALQKGANVNCKDELTGDTPLINSIINEDGSILVLLLRFGADMSIKNNSHKNAHDIAEENKSNKLLRILNTIYFNKHLYLLGYADKIIPYKLTVNEVGQIQKELNIKNFYNFKDYPNQQVLGVIDDN